MASPSSNANNQIVLVPDASSKRPSVGQGAGQSVVRAAAPANHAPAPVENNLQLLLPENDREYGCRYCPKKFSNKQALGGHQNAHKVERAMEKDNGIGYFGSPPSSYHGRFSMAAAAPALTSYNHRPNDFVHRSPYSWSFTSHQPGGSGARVIPYSSRAAAGGYYSRWSSASPGPRMGPFPSRPHYPLPRQHVNIRLANFGPGSSGAMRAGGGNNGPRGPINLRNVPAGGESNLDLSLKL